MNKTVAIYKNIKCGFDGVYMFNEHMEDSKDFIRISRPLDIEFEMLDDNEIINKQVDCLKEEKKDIQVKCEINVQKVEKQISELLALPAKGR